MLKPESRQSFSFARLIFEMAMIYLLSISLMIASVLAVNLIPNDAILRNLRLSLPTENYRVLFGAIKTDQWTECVAATIGLGPKVYELGLIERSLLAPMLGNCEESWTFLKTGTSEGDKNYWRYWHGSQIIMRPALAMMSVLDVRALTFFLFVSTFMFSFLALYRHGLQLPALAMLAGLFCVPLQSALFILPHAMDWIIGFLACGWIVARLRGSTPMSASEVICTFFFVGLLSAFFGLLNNPLVSLTIPLFGVFWAYSFQKEKNGATTGFELVLAGTFSWLIGYAASWSTKWLLAGLFVDGVFPKILDIVNYRLGGSFSGEEFGTAEITWTTSFREVLHQTKVAIIVVLACLIMSLLQLIRFVKTVKPRWSDLTSFILICALPFVWFATLRNHTIMHGWFVSAVLYISFAMALCLIIMSWDFRIGLSRADSGR